MSERLIYLKEKNSKEYFAFVKENNIKINLQIKTGKLAEQTNKNLIKRLNKTKIKNDSHNINFMILLSIIYLSMFIQIYTSKKSELRGLQYENYIIITIEEKGLQTIINEGFDPSSIQINGGGEIISPGVLSCELTLETNEIKIKWNSPLTSCNNMFKNLKNITKIDLRNFDFSLVNSIDSFFEGCTSLTSIDLSNKEAPNVVYMRYMFKGCISLENANFSNFIVNKLQDMTEMFLDCGNITSIDLSSFQTPELLFLSRAFQGCTSLTYINLDKLITSKVTSMQGMFSNCKSLVTVNLTNFRTESVQYMHQMFDQCNSLKYLDLSSFKTPSLLNMYAMFFYNEQLEYLDMSNFNTTLVTNMGQVFDQCHSLKYLNISNFYTPSATNMWHLFYNCYALEYLDISNFDTSHIISMDNLFQDCRSLKYLDLKSFNTSSVETMESMFIGCKNLEYVDLSSFNTENVKKMNHMFRSCNKITSLDLKHFFTPKLETMHELFSDCNKLEYVDISNFDTSKIKDMTSVFYGCNTLSSINIQNFDTSSVDKMEKMFSGCNALTSLNITNFKTDSVTTMKQMFDQCNLLTSLDISNFHTPLLTDMYNMFYNCYSLNYLDVRNLNTSKVRNFETLFFNCKSLTSLNLSSFDTSTVVTMHRMFESCSKLEYLDLNNFYTPSLENVNALFYNCENLKWVNISNFNTSSVTNFAALFRNCKSLTSLDIQNFDTKSAVYLHYLFDNCQSLTSLDITHFDTKKVENIGHMFDQCNSLTSLDLSNFDTTLVTNMDNMFFNCHSLKYLDVSNFNTEKINNMKWLFIYTGSLLSLNLSSFIIYNTTNVENMLGGSNTNLILCYNETKMPSKFLEHVNIYENSCEKLCIMRLKKFIIEIETCVDNCFSETFYKYEYKNICYSQCPVRTQLKNDSIYLCEDCPYYYSYDGTSCIDSIPEGYYLNSTSDKSIDKCPSKCGKCSLESNGYGLCISCNINSEYYPKYNDESNRDSFIQCYHKEEDHTGFYLDEENNIYKPCYEKCKKCESEGDDDNNHCLECIDIKKSVDVNGNCKCINNFNFEQTECLDSIPQGYYLNSSIDKTIDKCPSKCKICSAQSISYNLCDECNINGEYYPRYNDESNRDSYIQCYYKDEDHTGFYLDEENNIYKPCYEKCKKCEREGNDENNHCLECKGGHDYIYDNGNCNIKLWESSDIVNDVTVKIDNRESTIITELISSYISMISSYDNNIPTINTINIREAISDIIITESKLTDIIEKEEKKYSYDINTITEEAKKNKSQVYIDIDPETLKFIREKFHLTDEDKIFVTIVEKNNNDSNSATTDYIYEYTLENGTILNMSSIEEDIYIDVYVPITDLDLAQFDTVKQFAEQGYDIYDLNSDFYNDFCTPASMGDNDLTLEDRKKDVYPNITLCKSNCKYNGINLEEQRVICSCNLNSDKNISEDNEIEEDDGNFLTYLLDNINYKLFKCYKLFFNFSNLKKSYPFYIILIIYIFLSIINFIFICHSLERLKIYLAREMFEDKTKKNEIISETKKLKDNQDLNINKLSNPNKKKKTMSKKKSKMKNKDKNENKQNSIVTRSGSKSEKNVFICVIDDKLAKKVIEPKNSISFKNKIKKNYEKIDNKEGSGDYLEKLGKTVDSSKEKEENMNDLPYSKAIRIDNRNIVIVFYSIIIDKLELISIFCSDYKLKVIIFAEYILGLLINFFFNSLLYTDDVVSNKYHNNGELDIIVTLTLSIISNIVTSIFIYYIKYSRGIEERIKLITEIKYKMNFYRNIKQLLLYLRIKFICFFISQIIIVFTCMYYIVIFCVKYSRSQKSLIVNYCYSLVESLITSFALTFIILITRKIGLSCSNKHLYNTSKYINSKF